MGQHWEQANDNLAKITTGSATSPEAGFVTGAYSGEAQLFDWEHLRHVFAGGDIGYYSYSDHFLGAIATLAEPKGLQVTALSTGTSVVASNALTLTTAVTANDHITATLGLDLLVSNGPIVFDARFKVGSVVGSSVEVGLSDALTETAGEAFSDHTVAGITAIATDAIVVAYEDGGDANWVLNYVNTDAETGVDLAVAPANDTYITIRIVVGSDGSADVWLNGTLTSSVSSAVATTALLTPWVTIKGAGAVESVSVDYLAVSGGSGL